MNTSQMRTSSLFIARSSKGVRHRRLGLAETRRQTGVWENFLVEKKEGSGVPRTEAGAGESRRRLTSRCRSRGLVLEEQLAFSGWS